MKKKPPSAAGKQPRSEKSDDGRWCNPFQNLRLEGLDKPQKPASPKLEPSQPEPTSAPVTLSKEDQELLQTFAENTTAMPELQQSADSQTAAPRAKAAKKKLLTLAVERKGRGGKTVTIVRGLNDLPMATQMELCAAIKNALGTGARFREATLEIQGDQRERAATWLETKNFQCRILGK